MTTPLNFNNNAYSYPTVGDTGWGPTVTALALDMAGNIVTTGNAQTITSAKTFSGATSFSGLFITNAIKDQSANGTLSVLIDGTGNVVLTQNLTVQGTLTLTGSVTITTGNISTLNVVTETVTTLNTATLAATGAISTTSGNVSATGGFFLGSVSVNLTSTGTTQGAALALTALYNEVATVAPNTGVALPNLNAGGLVRVWNLSAVNALNVYPPSGDAIDGLGTNAAYSLPPLKAGDWVATSGTTWRTQNAVACYS